MNKFEKWLKKFVVVLIRLLVPGPNRKDDSNDWSNYKRILVFRLDNRLGNSILILSLVQSIKKSLPDVCLDVLMTSSYVELYQNHPDIQNVIPYDQKYLFRNPFRFLSLINHVRKNKYDAVFSSNNPDAFSVSQAIFSRVVTQNRSVGFDWKESALLYSDVITGNTNIHYAEAQSDLWRYFYKNAEYIPPQLYFVDDEKSCSDDPILVWLGATGNKFLNEDFVNSIILAIEDLNIGVSLAVGPHDRHVLDLYKKAWRDDIRVMKLDLTGIAKYFMSYKCICMPDTGPMHLVAALGIPLVQVFVDSNIKQYGYRGPNKYIIDKKVDVDALQQFVRKQLDTFQ
jgi:ADP-heptose:LPS heptosyltransferase